MDDLLANQGIALENGELPVIEQDGRHYILLPNVSVAEVLDNNDATTTHQANASIRYCFLICISFKKFFDLFYHKS